MSTIKAIRERLGVTQVTLAEGMGCTQGNVGHYERGQTVPPAAAKRLIAYAKTLGHDITFNDIYAPELAPAHATIDKAATETVATEPIQTTEADALRSGEVRRHINRRATDTPVDLDRRTKAGPPFQSPVQGVA